MIIPWIEQLGTIGGPVKFLGPTKLEGCSLRRAIISSGPKRERDRGTRTNHKLNQMIWKGSA